MIQILICDDETEVLTQLTKFIYTLIDTTQVQLDCFQDAKEVIQSKKKYDVCILDIDMPNVNGFDVAHHLKLLNEKTLILFFTCNDHLVFDAFQVHPYDFIRKQESEENILYRIKKAIETVSSQHHFYLYTKQQTTRHIPYDDILYFYKTFNDLHICTQYDELIERKALKDISIPINFFKATSSLILNMDAIYELLENQVILNNGHHFSMSPQKIRELRKHYLIYLAQKA